MRKRKTPLRKCVICGERKDKRDLIRVVKNKENEVFIDLSGKANGRGAYICKSIECLEKELKSKRLKNTLSIDIPADTYDQLRKVIEDEQ
ncbi:RNase P modulator RnpM [Abyssisolibacter fermentans]|uniref:RNase P modulator RnpM n=1 Tax=Abyssisolibacter fermentans TaxID=1766203 RepID=UPI00082E8E11|nr:YlxR family protein [Abyssisolibacter fermentans]